MCIDGAKAISVDGVGGYGLKGALEEAVVEILPLLCRCEVPQELPDDEIDRQLGLLAKPERPSSRATAPSPKEPPTPKSTADSVPARGASLGEARPAHSPRASSSSHRS